MIVKIVTLFLVGMVVLAMFGRLKMPKISLTRSAKCKKCKAPLVGKGPCLCGQLPNKKKP